MAVQDRRRRSSEADDDSLEAVVRARILDSLTTDLNADLVEYQCDRCQERCINPRRSVLEEAGVCLECHVHYAAHGHVRGRLSSRWD
jgi:formylmethanofuran dehydrogenase subunit E